MKSLANLVVSYPTIYNDSLIWIQDVRRKYDELNFMAIEPHFTLVFPIVDIDREIPGQLTNVGELKAILLNDR
jgi:hypothetical protein